MSSSIKNHEIFVIKILIKKIVRLNVYFLHIIEFEAKYYFEIDLTNSFNFFFFFDILLLYFDILKEII